MDIVRLIDSTNTVLENETIPIDENSHNHHHHHRHRHRLDGDNGHHHHHLDGEEMLLRLNSTLNSNLCEFE